MELPNAAPALVSLCLMTLITSGVYQRFPRLQAGNSVRLFEGAAALCRVLWPACRQNFSRHRPVQLGTLLCPGSSWTVEALNNRNRDRDAALLLTELAPPGSPPALVGSCFDNFNRSEVAVLRVF